MQGEVVRRVERRVGTSLPPMENLVDEEEREWKGSVDHSAVLTSILDTHSSQAAMRSGLPPEINCFGISTPYGVA